MFHVFDTALLLSICLLAQVSAPLTASVIRTDAEPIEGLFYTVEPGSALLGPPGVRWVLQLLIRSLTH